MILVNLKQGPFVKCRARGKMLPVPQSKTANSLLSHVLINTKQTHSVAYHIKKATL